MSSKPLEQCTLPELAQRLVEDTTRQDFGSIWHDENHGLVNDKVHLIRDKLDQGAHPDEVYTQGRTALDILVDPTHYTATDPKTVLALLEAGARTSEHVMDYVIGRLYAENTRSTAFMFHARSQSDKPLVDPERGNYYHALIDGDKNAFVLIAPMLDMVRRHDVANLTIDPEEIALLASWVFETRSFDGNTPIMLAWEHVGKRTFKTPEQAQQFHDFFLPDLWKITARYINNGGDVTQKNHQGNSILRNIFAHDPNLDSKAFIEARMDEQVADSLRAHLAAMAIHLYTLEASTQAPRRRM